MLKRHGFGLGETIGAVVALGAVGVVGYSMFSGECMLGGGCGVDSANSAPASSVTSVISSDASYGCSGGGCDSPPTDLLLASDAGDTHCATSCDIGELASECGTTCEAQLLATTDQSDSNLTMIKAETEVDCSAAKTACETECESEKPLD